MNALNQNTKITVSDINTLISELNGKLNLSGGKLTGELIRSGVFVTGVTDSGRLVLRGGTDSTSSLLQLVGKNSSDMAGWVALTASDGTNTNHLTVQPNGIGTLNGQQIITSNFKGCSSSSDGNKGLVPAPWKGAEESFLCANGSWAYPYFLGENHLSTGQDFNTVTKTGVYRFNTNHPNMPSGYDWGQLFVGHGGGDTIFQFVVGYSADSVYPAIRCGNPSDIGGAGQWTSWFKCSLMDMNNKITYPNGTQIWVA